jgi:Holliday junction resolvasome RuvABC endonuclease subunit
MRVDAEPHHRDALLQFAARAYRRPLSQAERDDLLKYYGTLRKTETILTKGHKGMTIRETAARVRYIVHTIEEFASDHPADLYVIEAPSFGSSHGSGHERAGLWWKTVDRLIDLDPDRLVPVVGVAPATRAKYITGNGRASKDVVLTFARHAYDGIRIHNHDEADAAGLAAMGSRFLGQPVEPHELTEGQMACMGVPQWPTVQR